MYWAEATLTLVRAQASDSGNYTLYVVDDLGGATTRGIRVTVVGSGGSASAPTITQQPQSQGVAAGNRVSLSVTATGTAPLSYQWRKNGTNIPGATASSYTINSAQTADAGSYSVVVRNSAGTVTSATAPLTVQVLAAPSITSHPQNQAVLLGQAANFGVSATGTAPLAYQWRKNGANILGATGATYSIPSAKATNTGTYTVVVSNAAGSVASNPATLTVNTGAAPTITTQPQNQTVVPGQRFTLNVTATGTAPLSYQWQKNGSNISGATGTSYSIPSAQPADSGSYTVVVRNAQGSVTSNPSVITVSSTPATTPPGADWVLNPSNGHYYKILNGVKWNEAQAAARTQGANLVTIRNAAENDWLVSQFGYVRRWIGATDEAKEDTWVWISGEPVTYTNWLSGEPNNSGDEDFGVINFDAPGKWNDLKANDPDTSSAIIEWVTGATQPGGSVSDPAIVRHPQSQSISPGQNVVFTVAVTGTRPFFFQWFKDGKPYDSENVCFCQEASLEFQRADASHAGTYTAVVRNSVGKVTSNPAILSLTGGTAPVITAHPQGQTINPGQRVTLSVTAIGTAPLTYQWKKNGSNISGATGSSYSIASAR